jgi:general secretion pathway protein B
MSYILDALKKAERERGIAQVPTISTVHELRARPPLRFWAVSGIAAACIGTALWFFLFGLKPDRSDLLSSRTELSPPGTNPSSLKPIEQLAPEGMVSSAALSAGSSQLPRSETTGRIEGNAARENSSSIPLPSKKSLIESPRLSERGSETVERREAQANAPPAAPPAGENSSESPYDKPAENPISRRSLVPIPTEEAKPAVESSQAKLPTLQEAMSTMTMSILLYSENKADRLVFINGRKYFEGDNVDDRFLLESITPEGAILSYKDERAILRPGSK